jgi:IS1 family transposase
MNQLSSAKRMQIIQLLVEGTSMQATARITGADVHTVMNLLIMAGKACAGHHDKTIQHLNVNRLQCDELWSFCYAKKKNVPREDREKLGRGDAWLWIAMDADTKLVISWLIGLRTSEYAEIFINDLSSRIDTVKQLTTDGYVAYIEPVRAAFGKSVNYAMLVKIYNDKSHYTGAEKRIIIGNPDLSKVSTSYIERQNLTIRMQNRRFTRDTNAFSKKLENHKHSVALYYTYYNFCRIHKTLRVTPAMEAGLAKHVWEISDIVNLIPEPLIRKRGPYKKRDQE